jgi:hypothetical protein
LALLVHTEHQRTIRRIEVEPCDVSRTFSTNIGSVESLKVSTRCGCRPKAPQMRCTLVTETPEALAIDRRLQWVASSGIVSSVFVTPR